MRRSIRLGVVLAGLLIGGALLFVPIFPVESQPPAQIHLDLEGGLAPGTFTTSGPSIPANCATWHELFPANCTPHHQDGYQDADGDSMISPCDIIVLDGTDFHIKWVGPTYFMTCFPPGGGNPVPGFIAEPATTDPLSESPVCEEWHWIWPQPLYCQVFHVDSWEDNGDGVFNECDQINVFEQGPGLPPTYYHIDRIGLDIIVEPGPVQTKTSTWGRLKGIFR